MATLSHIEWTEMTWNPVTGCNKVSPRCKHCYAERMAKRLQAMGVERYRTAFKPALHEDLVDLPRRWKKPRVDVAPRDNPTSEPEPDVIVLSRPIWEFKESNPTPADLRLVVEVSDTTLGFDLTRKAALYARASIVELWVLDVPGRRLVVHREPANGRYSNVVAYDFREAVAPLAMPSVEFPVAAAFRTT